MADHLQDPRLRISTPLPENALLIIGLQGTEEVSQPYALQLSLAAELGTEMPFESILGQSITVEVHLDTESPRYFSGVAEAITWECSDTTFDYYTIDLVPKFALLKNNVQCRIFQEQTVPDILRSVLTGLEVEYVLTGTYPKHNYCVQYRESDFAFACRLMEEEGIYYYFTHSADGHKLVVADASAQGPPCPDTASLIYNDATGGLRDGSYIRSWKTRQQIAPAKHTLWDHSFQLTGQDLQAVSKIQKSVALGTKTLSLQLPSNSSMQVFDYPGAYAQRFDGVGYNGQAQEHELQEVHRDNHRTAKIRMSAQAAASINIHGSSNAASLTSGHTFQLQRHPSADGGYFVTRVRHAISLPGYRGGISEDQPYSNEFDCIPIGLPYCPPRHTPVPKIHGMQTATVVGPEGEEIFTDKYGRVQIQFHWHGKGSNSCWVRVGQAWAGGQWGGIFIPRVGQEVIVSFLEGDPDAPLVMGSVYNSSQMPPFELPDHRTRMAIKSRSTPHGDSSTFSGIAIEDQKGSEHVQLHSERDMTHQSEQNHFVNTGQSYFHKAQSGRLRQTGSFPSVGGGGSGGGGSESTSTSTDGYHGPFDWADGGSKAHIGKEVSLTFGVEASSITGMNVAANIGASVDFFINPVNLIGEIPGVQGALGAVGGAVGAVASILTGAHSIIIFGTSANVHYGTKFNVQHGSHFDITGWNDETKKPTIVFASLAAAAITGVVIEAACLENDPLALAIAAGCTATLGGIATGLLTKYEIVSFEAMNTAAQTKKADELAQLAKDAANIAAPLIVGLEAQAAKSAKDAAESAKKAADEAEDALKNARQAGSSADAASKSAGAASQDAQKAAQAAQTPSNTQLVNGNYQLTAAGGNVTILSNYQNDQGGNLNLFATGSATGGGVAALKATKGMMLNGGSAGIGLCDDPTSVGSVKISSGANAASSITIMRADMGKNLNIDTAGITIDGQGVEAKAGIVTIKTSGGAVSITLTPDDSVKITAPNITFEAGKKISLTAPTVSISAETSFEVTGAKTSISGKSQVNLASDETSISLAPSGITQKGLTLKNQVETSVQTDTLTVTTSSSAESSGDAPITTL